MNDRCLLEGIVAELWQHTHGKKRNVWLQSTAFSFGDLNIARTNRRGMVPCPGEWLGNEKL
jgi:hypothetical protein